MGGIPFPYNHPTMKTPLGIGLSGQDMTPLEVVECCRLADQLGYDSFWLSEGHGGDQFTTLTACALATERIKLGTSIVSVFVRSAPTIAMAAACLDHFSQGRFILGLGSSHKVQVEGEHSVPYEKPITRLREYIDVIRTLLRDGEVSYKGSVLDIDRFDFWLPTLHPEVPIYAAAVFDKMLRTCGEITDGTILTWTTLSGAEKAAATVAEGARAAGRDPKNIAIADLITTVVSTDGPANLEGIRKATGFYAGFFPRYNRALAQNGFPDEAAAIRKPPTWKANGARTSNPSSPTPCSAPSRSSAPPTSAESAYKPTVMPASPSPSSPPGARAPLGLQNGLRGLYARLRRDNPPSRVRNPVTVSSKAL